METEKDYIGALTEANLAYEATRMGVKFTKWQQARNLAKYGIFSIEEVAGYIDTGTGVVLNALNREPSMLGSALWHSMRIMGRRVTSHTVFALLSLAKAYHERKTVPTSLLRLLVSNGVDYVAIERATGIPVELSRKVAEHGATYMSGVLYERS